MTAFAASGRSSPDALPIPDAAHAVVRGVLGDLAGRHSRRDLTVAARIVDEATDAICSDVFVVDPAWLDSLERDDVPTPDPADTDE